jgi:hypothetical protein
MSEEPEKKGPPQGWAKKRLPFNPSPTGVANAAFLVSIYWVLAVALLLVAAYFAFVAGAPITSPRVFVALIGAGYMGLRGLMIFNSRRKGARDARG